MHPCACFHFVLFIIVLGGVVWFRKQTPNLLIWFMVNDSNRSTDVLKKWFHASCLIISWSVMWCCLQLSTTKPFQMFLTANHEKLDEAHKPLICGCPIQFGERKCPEYYCQIHQLRFVNFKMVGWFCSLVMSIMEIQSSHTEEFIQEAINLEYTLLETNSLTLPNRNYMISFLLV